MTYAQKKKTTALFSDDYLMHHGIKGQKWGVRRFQNEDRTWTEAGKERYGSGNKQKNSHRKRLEANYREKGLSEEDARAAAAKRAKIEKIVAVSAAVAVTAAVTAVGIKMYKDYAQDTILSADTEYWRVEAWKKQFEDEFVGIQNPWVQQRYVGDVRAHNEGPVYLTPNKRDADKYAGALAKDLRDRYQGERPVYQLQIQMQESLKVASEKHVKDIFYDLYKNDAEFRENAQKSIKEFGSIPQMNQALNSVKNKTEQSLLGDTKKDIRNGYDAFNIALVNRSEAGTAATEKFYQKLREKGYGAIMDVNDKKYSGYGSEQPLIVFGPAYNWSAKKMTDDVINAAAQKSYKMMQEDAATKATRAAVKEAVVPTLLKAGGAVTFAGAVTAATSKVRMNRSQINQAKRLRNSGKSYAEIAEELGIPEGSVYNYLQHN